MNPWVRFFFGTPQRFLLTLAVLVIAIGLVNPDAVGMAVGNLLDRLWVAVQPVFWGGVTLFLVVLGLRILWRAVTGR